jgi:4-azaleucine resistance transporter AzlC
MIRTIPTRDLLPFHPDIIKRKFLLNRPRLVELRRGFTDFIPVGLVIFAFAIVFGILAVSSGLSIPESCAMSLTVFAGASQFMALPMINKGASVLALMTMALMVNMRHLLYGLNIGRMFASSSTGTLLGISLGIVDETYAFNTIGPGKMVSTPSYFMGTALCAYFTWNVGTLTGAFAGRWTTTLNVEGLDFAVLAVFISMIGASIRKWADWIVIAASGLVALVVSHLATGYWHLFIAGLSVPMALSWYITRKNRLNET